MLYRSLLVGVILAAFRFSGNAQVLYSENFDVDPTANWSFNSFEAGDLRADNANQEANFFYDYSLAGIPSAPGSVGTRGLKLEANVPDGTGVFAGLSVSPLGQSFAGDYILSFNAWHNYPTSGVGSTQMMGGGLGANTTSAQFPGGIIDGVYFAASSDGGTGTDYRAYINPGAPATDTSGVYAAGAVAGSSNNTHAYYSGFGGNAVPAAQVTLFSQQSSTHVSAVGSQGFEWHAVEIKKIGDTVTYAIDGTLIATLNAAGQLAGNNVFLGLFDINGTMTDAAGRPVNFALFDNVIVTQVPEPGAVGLLSVVTLLSLRRRRV